MSEVGSPPVPTKNPFSVFANMDNNDNDEEENKSDTGSEAMRLGQSPSTNKSDDLSYSNSSMPPMSSNKDNVTELDHCVYSSLEHILSQSNDENNMNIDVLADWVDNNFSDLV